MLPLILGFLGSAFAPSIAAATGIGALAAPLVAGSIGAGLGSTIETGDIGEGIKTGLGSFLGGSLLGGLMGGTAAGASPEVLAGQRAIGSGANAMTTGTGLTKAVLPPPSALGSTGSAGVGSGIKSALTSGMNYATTPTGIGSMVGTAVMSPTPKAPNLPDSSGGYAKSAKDEMKPIPRVQNTPPPGHRPGIDPEFDYGISTPFSAEDIVRYRDTGVLPYAKGGKAETEDASSKRNVAGNEKTEIVDAIMAVKGQHPQPEIALGRFLAKYGESALRDLVDTVRSGKLDETVARFASGEKGAVRGPGDGSGVDDKVPATIAGKQDVLLADGEFVLRKDTTDAIEKKFGGGFLSAVNNAGKEAPKVLKSKVAA